MRRGLNDSSGKDQGRNQWRRDREELKYKRSHAGSGVTRCMCRISAGQVRRHVGQELRGCHSQAHGELGRGLEHARWPVDSVSASPPYIA